MKCCTQGQCQGLERLFDTQTARNDLYTYYKNGPARTTKRLLKFIQSKGVQGASLLDIGGGIGAIQHEMVKAGVEQVTGVDASSAYLKVAQEEAERQGYGERANYHHGNFIDLADEIPAADIVTLDRVICCFPDMPGLVAASASHAKRFYALVFPVDRWWVKAGAKVLNLFLALQRSKFRLYIHPTESVDALVSQNGLQRTMHHRGILWQVVVYSR